MKTSCFRRRGQNPGKFGLGAAQGREAAVPLDREGVRAQAAGRGREVEGRAVGGHHRGRVEGQGEGRG